MSSSYNTGKSSYNSGSTAQASSQGSAPYSGGNKPLSDNPTTHYAYQLIKDEQGNVTGKDYVNNLLIYENEGKFGQYFKIIVKGPIPEASLFVAKKKSAGK